MERIEITIIPVAVIAAEAAAAAAVIVTNMTSLRGTIKGRGGGGRILWTMTMPMIMFLR